MSGSLLSPSRELSCVLLLCCFRFAASKSLGSQESRTESEDQKGECKDRHSNYSHCVMGRFWIGLSEDPGAWLQFAARQRELEKVAEGWIA